MPLRVTFHDDAEAAALTDALELAGYACGRTRELFAGDDDAEEVVHVVQTDAPVEEIEELIEDQDAWIEVSDPMTGTSAVVEPDLPDGPRRRTSG